MPKPTYIAMTSLVKSPFVRLQAKLSKENIQFCAARLRRSVSQAMPSPQTMRNVGVVSLTIAVGVAAGRFAGDALASDVQAVVTSPLLQIALRGMALATGVGWGGAVGPAFTSKPAKDPCIRSTARSVPVPVAYAAPATL